MSNLFYTLIDVTKNCNIDNFSKDYNVILAIRFFGYILFILKICLPLIIIILGSIDLGKAIFAGDDKAIHESTGMLFKRIASGIIIYFIPTILNIAISGVTGFTDVKSDYDNLRKCVFKPFSECSNLNVTEDCGEKK